MHLLAANVTDQLTDVSSVDVMIARVIAVVLAIVIAGLLLLLLALFRRVRTMASTLGQPPATTTTDEADQTIAAMTSLSVDQGNKILAALKFDRGLAAAHFAEIDQVLAERGPVIDRIVADVDDLKTARHEHGVRLGRLTDRLTVVETRLDTCPATSTPTTGG